MAYSFTSAAAQCITATNPIDPLNKPWTFAGWFYSKNATTDFAIMTLSPDNGHQWGLLGGGETTGDPVLANHSSVAPTQTTTGFSVNTWTHGAGNFPSNSTRTAYINGGSKGSSTDAERNPITANYLLIAGWKYLGSFGGYLDGYAAECAVWTENLTDAEIASLAKGFKPTRIRPQSLVFYAPLLRNLQDLKGGLALTNNNGATAADHPRVY